MKPMQKAQHVNKKNKGFMLVDALVAVVVVAIALGAMVYMYGQGAKSKVSALNYEQALHIAGDRMELIRKYGDGTRNGADVQALVDQFNNTAATETPEHKEGEATVTNVTYQVTCGLDNNLGNDAGSNTQVQLLGADNVEDAKLRHVFVRVNWKDYSDSNNANEVRLDGFVALNQ